MISNATVLSEAKSKLLEKYERGELSQSQSAVNPIKRRPAGEHPPLSLVQEQVWLRDFSMSGVPLFYNESVTMHRMGPLDVPVLERVFTEIIRRHEIWRTTFDVVDGHPVQVIHPEPSLVRVPLVDLRGFPEETREAEALRLGNEQAQRAFELNRGPLVRTLLVTLADARHQLFLTMHQTIVDGVSVYQVLPWELVSLYNAFSLGKPSPLPELPFQYGDFAYWERQWRQEEVLDRQVAYWRKQLFGELPLLQWPSQLRRPAVQDFKGSIHAFTLPKRLCEGLNEVSRQEGVTLFMTLLAGFTTWLHHDTQQNDIIVGTVAPAGRKRKEVQPLLGYFLNPVALRIDLSGDPTVRQLLRQSREVTSGALSHDDVPLECLVRELKPKPDPSRAPLFQTVLTLAPPVPELNSGWSQTPMDVDSGGTKWDLYVELSERPTGIIGRAQYNTGLFTSAMASRMMQHFKFVLEALVVSSERHISELPHFDS